MVITRAAPTRGAGASDDLVTSSTALPGRSLPPRPCVHGPAGGLCEHGRPPTAPSTAATLRSLGPADPTAADRYHDPYHQRFQHGRHRRRARPVDPPHARLGGRPVG